MCYIIDITILNYLSEGGAEGEDNYHLRPVLSVEAWLGSHTHASCKWNQVECKQPKATGVTQEQILISYWKHLIKMMPLLLISSVWFVFFTFSALLLVFVAVPGICSLPSVTY